MLKQEYSVKKLLKIIRRKHIISWHLWHSKSEKDSALKNFEEKINQTDELSNNLIVQKFKGKDTYRPIEAEDFLKIKLTNYFIKRIYKISQANRTIIIRQLKSILEDGSPYNLIKLDASNFYESIHLKKIIEKLKDDMYLSGKGIHILESLYNKMSTLLPMGESICLPRGIDISSTLSELYMSKIDSEIKNIDGIFFYARYVDDIIIVHKIDNDVLEEKCKYILNTYNLTLNDKKTEKISFKAGSLSTKKLDFLGYHFSIKYDGKIKKESKKELDIEIADKKLNKQKKRIIKAFLAYIQDSNFALLKQRIRFLSGVIHLKKNSQGTLCAGNAFNYCELLENSTSLQKLDMFVFKLLNKNKTRIEKLLFSNFSSAQKRQLLRISFVKGYKNALKMIFTRNQIKKIMKPWRGL